MIICVEHEHTEEDGDILLKLRFFLVRSLFVKVPFEKTQTNETVEGSDKSYHIVKLISPYCESQR